MYVITSLSDIRKQVDQIRSSGRTIGFVPTMGALHEGHLTLLRTAACETDVILCSIFVNPIQFNNPEDFTLYPRLLEEDACLLKQNGCDFLFAPDALAMYPEPLSTAFNFGLLETVMEGKFRPGHFSGVAAVVSKLFNLVKPHKAYFGQKDLQQYTIIKRLVTDLNFDLELVCHPIIRENDGLAMSSRNRRLTVEQRKASPHLYKALQLAELLIYTTPILAIKKQVTEYLQNHADIKLEYFEIVESKTLQPLAIFDKRASVALCIAAYVGQVRLIDNIVINPA